MDKFESQFEDLDDTTIQLVAEKKFRVGFEFTSLQK